jgi:GNAT superfamily N-acetyltransferase
VRPTEALQVRHHPAVGAAALADELINVHLDARAELLDQPFYSAARFADRLGEHLADPNFELVTGQVTSLLVGYAYGGSLPADTWWWSHLEGVPDRELTRETGNRTFWLRELLVRKSCQHRGYAHQLHDALLAGRHEERAVLFVRADNPARLFYRRWGWSLVGQLPPQQDSPRFEALLLGLPRADDQV